MNYQEYFRSELAEATANLPDKLKNSTDVIKVSVPMFIRFLEWAREKAKSDIEIHELTERVLAMKGAVINSDDYDKLMKAMPKASGKDEDIPKFMSSSIG